MRKSNVKNPRDHVLAGDGQARYTQLRKVNGAIVAQTTDLYVHQASAHSDSSIQAYTKKETARAIFRRNHLGMS